MLNFTKILNILKHKNHKIHHTAIIYPNVILGSNVEIGAYSVIGAPAEIKGQDNSKPLGKVYIGKNTIIREYVTIHSSRKAHGKTYISHSCYIQAHSHIGHDSTVHNNATIACYACLGGHTIMHPFSNLGLHTVTHPRTEIGYGTIIGCNGFAKGKLGHWSVYVGSPAKRIKWNNYLRRKLKLRELEE